MTFLKFECVIFFPFDHQSQLGCMPQKYYYSYFISNQYEAPKSFGFLKISQLLSDSVRIRSGLSPGLFLQVYFTFLSFDKVSCKTIFLLFCLNSSNIS